MENSLQLVSWEEVRNKVSKVNPKLAKVVDEIDPPSNLKLYLIKYGFGAWISKKGVFHIPNEQGAVVPISDQTISDKIRHDFKFSFDTFPPGVLLKNSYENFIEDDGRILPVITVNPGSIFGLWKYIDVEPSFHPVKIFNIRSGARSIFMLPKIGDAIFHSNLKRDFNVKSLPPVSITDQHQVFLELVESVGSSWHTELLFFSEAWVKKIKSSKVWRELYNVFVENAWQSSCYERNRVFYYYTLSRIQESRNLKPNPYLLDTVKHLLSIMLHCAPGFVPATDESMGPIKLIQKIYRESYGLKKYTPTIMHPAHFDLHSKHQQSVYYSLHNPTTINFAPKSRKLSSNLSDMRDLKHLMNVFLEELTLNIADYDYTIIHDIPPLIDLNYFHNKPDQHQEVKLTSEIVNADPRMNQSLYEPGNSSFAQHSLFLRGCVQISNKIKPDE